MKKKVIATSAVLGLAALVLGSGTLAYFTDSKEITNNFTVGNVKIKLIESQLHRANAGVANGATSNSSLWTPGINKAGTPENTSSVKNGHVAYQDDYFSDQQILDDSATYKHNDGYFTINATNMLPGSNVRKNAYVINEGSVDTYVRISMLMPKLATDRGLIGGSWTQTLLNEGAATSKQIDYMYNHNFKPDESMVKLIDGEEYYVFDFTFTDALKPGEMTFWNPWGNISISKDKTAEDFEGVSNFKVIVLAEAVQVQGFDSAEAAFAATLDK